MNLDGLSLQAKEAIKKAIASKGKYKGYISVSAPKADTPAYAARQAILMRVNSFKVSVGGIMFLNKENRAIYEEITRWIESMPLREAIKFDKDRLELESFGVW